MTDHAWVTMRFSCAALEGNTVMWKWLGCQQLLDMVSRAKSGFLSVFELVFFLLVLSGCPELTCQARTKGRWNKGGKWWWATMTVMWCAVMFGILNFLLSRMVLCVSKWSEHLMDIFWWSWVGHIQWHITDCPCFETLRFQSFTCQSVNLVHNVLLDAQIWPTVAAEVCSKEVDLSNFLGLPNVYQSNTESFS